MTHKLMKYILILLVAVCMPLSVLAHKRALPQNYMMEKHRISEPLYCDLDDPVEEIACMAWDAALGAAKDMDTFPFIYTIAAANLVQQTASSSRYNLYVNRMGNDAPQGLDSNKTCVVNKIGICGNHQLLFESVMQFAELRSRRVGIYYTIDKKRNSHAASEVFINDKWRFIDTTWGAFWLSDLKDVRSMLSFDEILKLPKERRDKYSVQNKINVWSFTRDPQSNFQFQYFDFDHLSLLSFAEVGTLSLDLRDTPVLRHVPNYVGTHKETNTGITMRWAVPNHEKTLNVRLDVAGVGGCSSNGPILLDDSGKEYPLQRGSNRITVPNGGSFNVKRDRNEICYIVFSDIALLD